MGYVSYIYYLSPDDYIVVRFYSQGKRVAGFVVNYVSVIHGQAVTIRRYDMHHGKLHLDIMKRPVFRKTDKGRYRLVSAEQEKVWLEGDEGEIMRKGRNDIIAHWHTYKRHYIDSIIYH